ncbi:LAGLIDADG family homing endonuclease [Streptomyces sp. 5-10]|uniref:LAGLIDADG family homing endonuclease n=1 Tax=Streptomyces sp. 5-10 TaxID=878925 RepID=UPI00168ACADD|nr:LAGLIDADG family homing endonuclease [Streptomyces sp. 5-10]MBD3004546.1 hypothetical protein [Streptomyces sp. 5-10]
MSKTDRDVAASVAAQLRNQARQAGWMTDPAGWARDVLGVHMWSKQQEITESVIKNKRTVVASCHGTGKALAVETPIPTPGGFMSMGDMKTGMKVLGSDGSPVTVTATTGIHTASRYRIVLEGPDGDREIIASGDHLWPVLTSRPRAAAELKCQRAGLPLHTGLWQHKTRTVSTIELKKMVAGHQRLTIPAETPQLHIRGPRWTPDPWISKLLLERGCVDREGRPALSWETHHTSGAPSDVAKVRAWMSARGVHTLLHKKREGQGATWTLSFAGDASIGALPDLDARAVAITRHLTYRDVEPHPGWRVKSVKQITDGEVQCIEVDAPDHLYLCGTDRIPTHNSMISSVLICWWISTRPVGEAIAVSCYTDDTEVLTRDGWKLFKDVQTGPDGDEFATRSPKTKTFEWQKAFQYHEAPWDGEIVDIKGRSVDLRVTPNHRMLTQWSVYKNGQKEVGETFKRADSIGPRGSELPALSSWRGKTPKTVSFGKYTWDTLDFAAFLGAWMAEGSLGPKREYVRKGGYAGSVEGDVTEMAGPVILTQLPHTKGYEPYRKLLARMIGREPARSMDKNWFFSCSDLYEYLKPLGKAGDKYIPDEVKNWGPEALEKFLEFYLLGDGWFQKSQGKRGIEGYGSWRSCTVSKRLADDLQEVAQKIGRHATITEREPRDGGAFEDGRRILKENCRTGYYLIFGDCQTKRIKASRSQYKGNVYCVSVPNESLYVRRGGSPIWCGNTAPTYAQVNKILWEEIRKHHATAKRRGTPLPGYVTQGDEWKADDGQILAFGRKPAHGDRHGFQGIHRRFVLGVIDEACGVPEEIWTGIEAITTNEGCRILAVGNPDDRNTEFGAMYTKPENAQDWHRISVPASSTPNFTGEEVPSLLNEVLVSKAWAEERLRAWGKDDPRYISKVLARFPEQSQSSLFPPAVINQAFEDVPVQPVGPVVRIGVDVARFGTDETVVSSYIGSTARIEEVWAGTDTVSSAYRVLRLAEEIKDRLKSSWVEIRVDAVGLGAGVVDTLNARAALLPDPWFSVYEMHGSASPPVDVGGSVHGYGNARAFWFDQLRQSMRNGTVKIEENQQLRDDLAIVFYFIRTGKLFIIPKEEMRQKHGRSPDYADALVYATAPVAEGLEVGSTVSEDASDMAHDLSDLDDDRELSIAPF